MIILKIFLCLIIAVLWRLGGWDKARWSGYRDVLVPILMGIAVGVYTMNIWLAIATIGAYNIVRVGYGAYDPEHDDKPSFLGKLTKDREGSLIRAIVGLLYGLVGTIPYQVYSALVLGFFQWKVTVFYALSISFVSFILSKLKARDFIIEPAIGFMVGSLVFYI